jgi:hypothetical protein
MVMMFCLTTNGQFIDSLPMLLKEKKSLDARLESRYSFIDNELISVTGIRLGVAFRRKIRLGAGLSWLETPYQVNLNGPGSEPDDHYLRFMYVCYYLDVVFHKTKRWQLSVPIQAGTGASWFQAGTSKYRLYGKEPRYLLLLYEPGITVQFKVFKWFGLGADVAYRFTLKNSRNVGNQLSSPTYSFKILFWPDLLYFDLFPESKISKRFGPAYW